MPRRVFQYVFPVLLLALLACKGKPVDTGTTEWSAANAAREYQMIQAELKLSEMGKPYLVINFARKQLRLKLKGTVVWDFPIDIEKGDVDEVEDFVDQFHEGHRLVRPITATHLFAYKEQTPDSILAIISEVTKFKPELLQRELPSRFQLLWGDNVILEIRTDVVGKPADKFKNTIFEVRHLLQGPLGATQITIKMDPVHAMTLYRVAQPGLQTIVQPPSEK